MTTGLERFNKKFGNVNPVKEVKPKESKRKVRKEVKEAVIKEQGDFTGINKDWEGKLIKQLAEERAATINPADKLEKLIKENGIAVADDWLAVDKGFANKLRNDGYEEGYQAGLHAANTNAEENEEMNIEQMKELVKEIVAETRGADLKMIEAVNKQVELKLALAEAELKLEVARASNPLVGKVEEVPTLEGAVEEVEEQFKPKKVRRARKKQSTGVTEDMPTGVTEDIGANELMEFGLPVMVNTVALSNEVIEAPVGLYTPLRKGNRGLTIDWKTIEAAGLFDTTLVDIVMSALEQGIDVESGKELKSLGGAYNGAYQQFMMKNKGTKGAWKTFVNQHIVLA